MTTALFTLFFILGFVVVMFSTVYLILTKAFSDGKYQKKGELSWLSRYLLFLGLILVIFSFFAPSLVLDYLRERHGNEIIGSDTSKSIYELSGPLGDTMGGIMNPFIAIAGVIVTGLAFYMQYQANRAVFEANEELKNQFKLQQFESQLYKLLDYHRSNIAEMEFVERNSDYRGQKVFKSIITDIEILFAELKRFFDSFSNQEILTEEFRKQLEKIKIERENINVLELARINLAYYIIFIGLSATDTMTLMRTLKKLYNMDFLTEVLFYFRLKPSNPELLDDWNLVKNNPLIKGFRRKYTPWCTDIKESEHGSQYDQDLNYALNSLSKAFRYYGGHQFRLSHYFRNLFYIYKMINNANFLDFEQKNEYSKVIRSQLSTFELYILFYNSISKMGWNWEFNKLDTNELQLITRYSIIKNIPGLKIRNEIDIENYYPNIKYEFGESKVLG